MKFEKHSRKLVLLLSVVLILCAVVGTTVAYVVTGTAPLKNVFVSGLDPEGDLVIRKAVMHPYGEDYAVPASVGFAFTVELGEAYAGETVSTSLGDMTAGETGALAPVIIRPGFEFVIEDL